MNGRNRHMQYRRSVYRRRRIKLILIVLGAVLVIGLALFLIVGNLLHDRSEADRAEETDRQATTVAPGTERTPIGDIQAYPVAAQTTDSTTLRDRLIRLIEAEGSAASIALNQPGGTLLYQSSVAGSLGVASEYTITAEGIGTTARELGIHVSGVYHLTSFASEDALLRSVSLAREAAILAEAAQGGIDDLVLLAPDLSPNQIDELLHLVEDIRRLAPDAVIGLSLPSAVLEADNAAALIDRLYERLDFLALDATHYGEAAPAEHVEATITDSGMLYYLLRYHMRVLLPAVDDTDSQNAMIHAVQKNGLNNWQILS
ncbi:MAG: hypothetical protein IJW44_02765 [Clostridia bacterium]|nr:hypothetical protein [Clostridia bacterium]